MSQDVITPCRGILKATGVNPVKLPARSPNLNAHAERFVRSIRGEGLNQLILLSEEQLQYVLCEYLQYYHQERNHQGLNRIIGPRHEANHGEITCIDRLRGLLKSYHRNDA
jgi:putative transposase